MSRRTGNKEPRTRHDGEMRKLLAITFLSALTMLSCDLGTTDDPDALGASSPAQQSATPRPQRTDYKEPPPKLFDDGVISVRPKQVTPGGTMTIVVKDPPGYYGLGWNVDRREGSDLAGACRVTRPSPDCWEYIGGFRAGPEGQWKDHKFNNFYFRPEWDNVGLESIAFSGNDSMDLKVPELEPGTYRLAHPFTKARGLEREWHIDVFEVIEP